MVQIQGFLNGIDFKLLNYADLNLTTTKMLVNLFYDCLSPKEQSRNQEIVDRLLRYVNQQISLNQVQDDIYITDLSKRILQTLEITDLYLSKKDIDVLEKMRKRLR